MDSVLNESQIREIHGVVQQGMNAVMDSSVQFFPPFIGSLQASLIISHMITALPNC